MRPVLVCRWGSGPVWQHHRRGHHCRVIRTWRHLADQLEDWSRRPNHFQQHCERKDPRPTPRSSVRRALESIIRSWSSCSDSATDHRADAEDGSHEAGSAEDVLHGRHPARVQHAAHRHATCSDSCAHRGRRHHRTQPHDDVDDGAFLSSYSHENLPPSLPPRCIGLCIGPCESVSSPTELAMACCIVVAVDARAVCVPRQSGPPRLRHPRRSSASSGGGRHRRGRIGGRIARRRWSRSPSLASPAQQA